MKSFKEYLKEATQVKQSLIKQLQADFNNIWKRSFPQGNVIVKQGFKSEDINVFVDIFKGSGILKSNIVITQKKDNAFTFKLITMNLPVTNSQYYEEGTKPFKTTGDLKKVISSFENMTKNIKKSFDSIVSEKRLDLSLLRRIEYLQFLPKYYLKYKK